MCTVSAHIMGVEDGVVFYTFPVLSLLFSFHLRLEL